MKTYTIRLHFRNRNGSAPLYVPIRYLRQDDLHDLFRDQLKQLVLKTLWNKIYIKPKYNYPEKATVDLVEREHNGSILWKGKIPLPEEAVQTSRTAREPVMIRPKSDPPCL